MATHYEIIHGIGFNGPPPKKPKSVRIGTDDPEHHIHYGWVDENDHSKGKDPDKLLGPDGQPIKPSDEPIELIN